MPAEKYGHRKGLKYMKHRNKLLHLINFLYRMACSSNFGTSHPKSNISVHNENTKRRDGWAGLTGS